MKSHGRTNIIRILILSSIIAFGVCCVYAWAQTSTSFLRAQDDSYLDGFDMRNLLGGPELSLQEQQKIATYLDEIEDELSEIEESFVATGAIEGVYTDFESCIQDAIGRHLPLVIAKDKINLAKRKLITSVRELFPSFSVEYEHNKGYKLYKADSDPDPNVDTSQQFRSERIRYTLEQPIYRGGALWNQVKVDKAELQMAKEEYKKVFSDLTVEIARAYLSLTRAKTMLEYKRQLAVKIDEVFRISQEKMEAGLISEIEHLNVQSQQSQMEHDLQAAREEVELALIEFKKIMHLEVEQFVDVQPFATSFLEYMRTDVVVTATTQGSDDEAQEKKLDELVMLAYQNRPELKIQQKKLQSASLKEKIKNAGWLPEIALVAEKGRKAEAYTTQDNNPVWDDEHHIGVQVRWNFGGNVTEYAYDKNRQGSGVEATETNVAQDGYYDRKNTVQVGVLDGLEQYADTKEAQVKTKEALLELELAEKDIVSEVKESYYNYSRAAIKLRSVFKKIDYREKLVKLSYHRSEINEIEISEYIQSELDLINERNELYQSILDYYMAKVSLNKAIGIRDYFEVETF